MKYIETERITRALTVLLIPVLFVILSCSALKENSSSPDGKEATSLTPDPAFYPLLDTLQKRTTAPIMLPGNLPPKLQNVAIGSNTRGDEYEILFLGDPADPYQLVRDWVHAEVGGTLTAEPASTPLYDWRRGGAKAVNLKNITLRNGTVADLKRVEPPEGANTPVFMLGRFEEGGTRYTLTLEFPDTPKGDLARRALSTMIKVPDTLSNDEASTTETTGISGETSKQANSKIAFASGRDDNAEVYVMDADGSNQTRLTDKLAWDFNPTFSPDGTKIAFTSNRDGNLEIYAMDADGSNQTRLTDNAANDFQPAFSPDGENVAFVSEREGNQEIYVMDADGSNQDKITDNPAWDVSPAFSPDGSKLAFASGRDGNWEIYVMNADGSNQTRLTDSLTSEFEPVFSSDGGRIVFASGRDGNVEVYVMDADGSKQTRLTDNPAYDGSPTFSSDGAKIAFTSSREGSYDVYVMDTDGSTKKRLTFDIATDHEPAFLPHEGM